MPPAQEYDKFMKGLVDTCFEEGQYEAGITLLDQMRSSSFKPVPLHIRELVFLMLYPPVVYTLNDRNAQEDLIGSPSKLESPSKLRPKRRPLIPTEKAGVAALRLLNLYAHELPPASILRALPSYDDSPLDIPERMNNLEEDAYIGTESQCILECRSCWELLRETVVKPKPDAFREIKGRKRRRVDDQDIEDELRLNPTAIVGKNSWSLLALMVVLFQRDEAAGEDGTGTYSSHLVAQIPPPKAGTGQRWDVGASLDVVFACFEEESVSRRSYGVSLLRMLVNLLSSRQVNVSSFTEAIIQRLQNGNWALLDDVLKACGHTAMGLWYKISLCQRILQSGDASGHPKSKPNARNRPQPRARARGNDPPPATEDTLNETSSGKTLHPSNIPGPILSVDELSRLLVQPLPKKNPILHQRVKVELLLASVAFHRLDLTEDGGDKGSSWLSSPPISIAIQDLHTSIEKQAQLSDGVGPGEERHPRILLALLATWGVRQDVAQ